MSPAGGPASTLASSVVTDLRAQAPLPERPPISQPDQPRERVLSPERSRGLRQPWLGLAGLLLVVPVAVALAVGAGGDGSVLVLGPLVDLRAAAGRDGRLLVGGLARHPAAPELVGLGRHGTHRRGCGRC